MFHPKKEKKHFSEISKFYEKEFLEDLRALNCEPASIILRVTDHIPQIVMFIQRLVDAKQAYVVESGSVYFDQSRSSIKNFTALAETNREFDSKGEQISNLMNLIPLFFV